MVSPFYFVVNNVNTRPENIVTIRRGDIFNIKVDLHQVGPFACPRMKINSIISNTSMITAWTLPKEGGPNFRSPYEKDEDPSRPTIESTFLVSDASVLVAGNMKVPMDAELGYYELPVTYTNPFSGDQFSSTLRFQIESRHKTFIPRQSTTSGKLDSSKFHAEQE